MSIAIYVHDLRASGVVRNALAIAGRLARDRPVTVVAGERRGLFAGFAVANGVAVETLARPLLSPPGRIGTAMSLRRWLRAARPELVLSAGNYGHATVLAAARGLAMPRIYRISNEIGRAGALRSWWRERRTRLLVADAARLALVGEQVGRAPFLAPLIEDGRARVINAGIDVDHARTLAATPSPHPWLDASTPVVIAVGRLHPQKNLHFLLRAFVRARAERPMRLVILGDGPINLRTQLRHQAERLGVAADFLDPGETPDVFAWVARASLFALPSLWEGSSVALLEALAVGTPVVASTTAGDATAVLGDGRWGLLADPQDERAFAAAMLHQLGPTRVIPGERAQDYGLDRMLDEYAQLVEDVLRGGRRGRARALEEGVFGSEMF